MNRLSGEKAESLGFVAQPGELVEVARELVLCCVARDAVLPGEVIDPFPFGEADADGIVGESGAVWQARQRLACAELAASEAAACAAAERGVLVAELRGAEDALAAAHARANEAASGARGAPYGSGGAVPGRCP